MVRPPFAAAPLTVSWRAALMADNIVPHFANDRGAEKIFVGVREFKCMGARAPFDHPHVYLDMGQDTQILCPYCSTLFVRDDRLAADDTDPPGCRVGATAPA
jgi:uncharacterized Zn-finger protein